MAKGIDSYIREQFGVADVDVRTYSPLTLAYIGDGIFDLVIRSVVVGKGNTRANQLHQRTTPTWVTPSPTRLHGPLTDASTSTACGTRFHS